MEKSLLLRGLHFLRKAGVRRFTHKTALWAQASIDQRYAAFRDRNSDTQLKHKLAAFPREGDHVTVSVMDFTMKLRADDPGLSKELILHGIRECDAVHYLKPYLSQCKSILEIGANQGYYLIQEALHSPADAKIHAFEPHPENLKTAKLNVTLNGIENKCH